MVTGKDTEYKFIWFGSSTGVEGVGVLVSRDRVVKIVEVNVVNDRLMFLKLLIVEGIITIVSAYAPQQELADIGKDKFYELLISSLPRLSENEVVFLGCDLNGHEGRSSNGYEGVHGSFGYGTRNQKGERILELGAALDMCVCNTFFKKREQISNICFRYC